MPDSPTPAPPERTLARARSIASELGELYPFEPHFTPTPGGWQHYVDVGPKAADPILCVHGNPTWSFVWRRVANEFAGQHRVVAPDHLGCGLSEQPQDWSYRLADHVANLERLVLELDLRRITLVVHDWGGAIGMGVAVRHPERFERLFVSNTAAFPASLIPKRIAVCRAPGLGPLLLRGLGAFERAALFMATEKPLAPEIKRGLLAPYRGWSERVAIARFVQDIPMQTTHPSWDTLVAIDQKLGLLRNKPLALVWGERDFCFTPHFRHKWQERFAKAEVVPFDEAGHYLFEDEPERYLGELRAFIARHPLKGPAARAEGSPA